MKTSTLVSSASCLINCVLALYFDFHVFFNPNEKTFVRDSHVKLYTVFKSLAAFSFLYLCLHNYRQSVHKTMAKLILLGQFLSVIGDIMLALSYFQEVYFLIGGASFLFAHVAYMSAFVSNILLSLKKGRKKENQSGSNLQWIRYSFSFISVASYFIGFCYVIPSIKPELTSLRTLAIAYTIMITIMVGLSPAGENLFVPAVAAPTTNDNKKQAPKQVLNKKFVYRVVGSFFFYLSDICVARNKFIGEDFMINKAVGLPLYFVAQLIIASSL